MPEWIWLWEAAYFDGKGVLPKAKGMTEKGETCANAQIYPDCNAQKGIFDSRQNERKAE